MGSRAQIEVQDDAGASVFLYTHNGASELLRTVQTVLERRARWTDSEYLARMLFSAMVKGDIDGEQGFGIGTQVHSDLDYPPIVVNVPNKKVTLDNGRIAWTFEDFCNLDPTTLDPYRIRTAEPA